MRLALGSRPARSEVIELPLQRAPRESRHIYPTAHRTESSAVRLVPVHPASVLLRLRLCPRYARKTERLRIIHRSSAASTLTIKPISTCAYKAAATVAKPSNQGARIAQTPSARLTHSSHSLNAKRAPRAMSAIAAPTIQAFLVAAISLVKPSAQGANTRQR